MTKSLGITLALGLFLSFPAKALDIDSEFPWLNTTKQTVDGMTLRHVGKMDLHHARKGAKVYFDFTNAGAAKAQVAKALIEAGHVLVEKESEADIKLILSGTINFKDKGQVDLARALDYLATSEGATRHAVGEARSLGNGQLVMGVAGLAGVGFGSAAANGTAMAVIDALLNLTGASKKLAERNYKARDRDWASTLVYTEDLRSKEWQRMRIAVEGGDMDRMVDLVMAKTLGFMVPGVTVASVSR